MDVLICDYELSAAFRAQTNRRLITTPLLPILRFNSVLILFDGLLFHAWQLKTAVDHIGIHMLFISERRFASAIYCDTIHDATIMIIKLLVIYAQYQQYQHSLPFPFLCPSC